MTVFHYKLLTTRSIDNFKLGMQNFFLYTQRWPLLYEQMFLEGFHKFILNPTILAISYEGGYTFLQETNPQLAGSF